MDPQLFPFIQPTTAQIYGGPEVQIPSINHSAQKHFKDHNDITRQNNNKWELESDARTENNRWDQLYENTHKSVLSQQWREFD